MKRMLAVFLIMLSLVLAWSASSHAAVAWDVQRELKIEGKPRDVAMSLDGRWIFVLTDKGRLLIYSPDGELKDTIHVGNRVDGIRVGPVADVLLLTSRKDSTVKIITLDFIQDINVSGSPFKGPENAAIAIATFSDFQ